METADKGSASVSITETGGTVDPVATMLADFMGQADRHELASVAIAFIRKDGAAAVQSTPMPAMHMNHLLTLFDRKVARVYDRVLAAAEQVRSPTGAVTAHSPKAPEVLLPRKVRRQVAAQQRKVLKKAVKRRGLAGPPLPPEQV